MFFSHHTLPNTRILESWTGDRPVIVPVTENNIDYVQARDSVVPNLSPYNSNSSLVKAMNAIKFNDLPNQAQYLKLNYSMVQLSRNSALILSTLLISPLGIQKSEEESLEYVRDIDVWLERLPLTMLINSQTMTVTTSL